ncbi:hypothetical protein N866_07380 [Actinotalea ferrariae CF5-4]|uniref:AMIN-like domain-containing protein n=1 Tax=Actinotalea ferrariae CF5-4 TaxID=948458 RepID=A0A021VR99_9CELL|nr:hypothetical protein [Actinotalea ferrariae]EYR62565.1 hypothetical protein N866_07380 [Actinotalea ferrariae CF5-4]
MRRPLLSLLAAVAMLLGLTVVAAPAASAHPYCGQVWGSLAERDPDMSAAQVTNIRAGRHACFDRLVLDADGPIEGYSVRYVDAVVQDGSGFEVPVRGGARLQVVAHAGVIATDAFFLPDGRLVNTSGYRTFRDVVWAGSFEGMTSVGLGVRARLPFRVFVLDGPGDGSRLVVDVAHRWCAPGHSRC